MSAAIGASGARPDVRAEVGRRVRRCLGIAVVPPTPATVGLRPAQAGRDAGRRSIRCRCSRPAEPVPDGRGGRAHRAGSSCGSRARTSRARRTGWRVTLGKDRARGAAGPVRADPTAPASDTPAIVHRMRSVRVTRCRARHASATSARPAPGDLDRWSASRGERLSGRGPPGPPAPVQAELGADRLERPRWRPRRAARLGGRQLVRAAVALQRQHVPPGAGSGRHQAEPAGQRSDRPGHDRVGRLVARPPPRPGPGAPDVGQAQLGHHLVRGRWPGAAAAPAARRSRSGRASASGTPGSPAPLPTSSDRTRCAAAARPSRPSSAGAAPRSGPPRGARPARGSTPTVASSVGVAGAAGRPDPEQRRDRCFT